LEEEGKRSQQNHVGGNAQRQRSETPAELIEKRKEQSSGRAGSDQTRDSMMGK
jgi:hypothetical protein